MKKRLLSAALALAMVLTLLPVSVFAAYSMEQKTPQEATYTLNGVTHHYFEQNGNSYKTVQVARATSTNYTDGRVYGNWYFLANQGSDSGTNQKYYEVTSGIVTGVSGSGQWYPDVATYSKTVNGNTSVNGGFTVLDSGTSLDLSSYTNSSLQVDISADGATLTVPANITSLTITSKWLAEQGQKGSLAAINIDRSAFASGVKSGLTLTAENINIGGINLEGRSNTVTLKNCTVSGAITMSGTTVTSQQGNTTYTAQKLTTTGTVLNGAVTLKGDGSTAKLTDTTGGQGVSILQSNGGSVTVEGRSVLGAITTEPRLTTGQWPSVSVTGGTVKSITQQPMSGNSNSIKIDVGSTNPTGIPKVDGTITAERGTVNIISADAASVIVKAGTLNISGSGVDVKGTVYLGATDTTTLSITATGSTFGGITAQKGANLVISQWIGKRWSDGGNNYGTLALGDYSGKKVTGGTFSASTVFNTPSCLNWLDAYTTTGTSANLQFYVQRNGNVDLYSKTELARAISDISTANAKTKGNIVVLGQAATYSITLMNGNVEWANIGFDTTTGIVLPTQINNVTINEWIGPNNAIVAAGKEEPIAKADITLNATGITSSVKRFTNVSVPISNSAGNGGVQNQNVNVTLNGNNIALSGAVNPGAGGWATVYINLETDVVDTDGKAVVLENVVIEYNPSTRAVVFSTWQPAKLDSYGVIVQNGELVLNKGTGAHYTVSANLSVSASDLGLYVDGKEIQATVGGNLSRWTQAQKDAVIKYFTDGSFDIGSNQAVQVAINAAQATITNNSSVATWVTNAKNTIWRSGLKDANGQYITVGSTRLVPHTGNFDPSTPDGQAIANYFGKAYLVPYLVVNITAFDENGTLTATLTPYYRVDVSGNSSVGGYQAGKAYTAQAGRALTLASNSLDTSSPVEVTFQLPAGFNNKYMHQDGKYVYQATGQTWKISHSGTGSTLGTIVINDQAGPIVMTSSIVGRKLPGCTYDSLQAAIDDTVPGVTALNNQNYYSVDADTVPAASDETMDIITIGGTYTGSCDITMTGFARKVLVIANGQQNVKSINSSVSVQNAGGWRYIVQLVQDVGVTGNVVITVSNPSTNVGTISASTSRASAGQVVTVTAAPAAGYALTGIRAVTDTGATVNVTSTGTANQYSFTVPTGAASITITPSFGVAGRVQINVASVANGTATTNATGGTVQGGSVVTVYTVPSSGYRATSVTVSTNVGNVSATNTGTNTWTFTVPANATTVTVTPNFGVDSGLPFIDVGPNDYYLNAVKFVYSHGMMQGDGSTTFFNGTGNITRGQIVTILYRLENSPAVSLNTSFKDVPANQYYAAPVAWASANGIVTGRNSTTFDPNANITRQELAAILYRYNTQYKKLSTGTMNNLSAFTDRDRVDSDFAITPMQWAVGNGIITGTTPTTLSPSGTATRYQAATMLMRYCQSFLKMS